MAQEQWESWNLLAGVRIVRITRVQTGRLSDGRLILSLRSPANVSHWFSLISIRNYFLFFSYNKRLVVL